MRSSRLPIFQLSILLFGISLLAASQLFGQASDRVGPVQPKPQQQQEVAPATIPSEEYIICADDLLDIYIIDVPELSRTYRVSQSGQLNFPLLPKPLNATGLTLDEFARLLTTQLKSTGTLTDPHIDVSVKESRNHSVSINGAVKNPQIYPLLGRAKLLSVISQAGGIADDAGDVVKITRGGAISKMLSATNGTPADSPQTITINLNELLNSSNSSLNVDVYPGDWVTVPKAGVVYVVGAVNRSGGFVMNTAREHMTVLQAVALAEDLKPTAQREHSMIIRRDPSKQGDRQEIAVNLKKILSGQVADVTMEPNDILFVPDSSSKKALRRGAEAAIQIATGLALFRL
ncbi:MAG TPA: polysaccharide biosynthesis/export family protein [Candidatus Angelobacter sp.]|nr:polysaccharide biosynthesis/export family protein [Candidatus Angelobacter sp.]